MLSLLGRLAGFLLLFAAAPTWAAEPLKSEDTNIQGVVAEVTECRREEGVLTMKLRLRNTGDDDVDVTVISSLNYDLYYVVAGSKKYFILRDTEKTPLASPANVHGNIWAKIKAGGSFSFWARYPAPPAEVKKVSFYTPLTPPLDNIPIGD